MPKITREEVRVPADVMPEARDEYITNYLKATRETGRLMLFACDQKIEHLNKDFYGEGIDIADLDPEHLFKIGSEGVCGVLAGQRGLVAQYAADYPEINYLIKMNSKTNLVGTKQEDPYSPQLYDLDAVLAMKEAGVNIVGLGYTIYLGSEYEATMMAEAGELIAQAHANGLIVVLWIYPRGKAVKAEKDPALIAGAVLSTVGFLMAFFYVAPVGGAAVNGAELIGDVMVSQKMLLSQKIFYFHMPVAITSFIALGFGCYYAVRFLMTKNQRFDTCSRICLEIALLFVVLTMITGEMWTRFEWGVWWSWEPRLTTYLILMLIVIAYFVLRSSVDEPERRATFAAVVAIIATIDVPICFMITRLIPSSIHPVVLREGGMSPEMGMCVGLCALGMLLVGFVLYRTRFNQVRLTQRVEALKETLDDER